MDNFYDINDFIVFLMRKWKSFLIIVILLAVGYAGNRGIGLFREFLNQSGEVEEKVYSEDEPVWSKVLVNIQIEPVYQNVNGVVVDETQRYIEGYRKLGINENVLEEMYENWYDEEAQEVQIRKKKLHEYGYILHKELKYPYKKVDFWGQFLVDGVELNTIAKTIGADNSSEHIITMGFKSSDEELAKKIAYDYANKTTELVKDEIGEFEYSILGETVLYELPAASAGAQTTRVVNNISSNSKITMKYVIIQTLKGLVWGGVIGVFASIIVLFFAYMMSRKLYTVSDIKKYNLPMLGFGFSSRKKCKKFWGKVYCILEGYKWDCTGTSQLITRIDSYFGDTQNVIVVGTSGDPEINEFVEKLNLNTKKYIVFENESDVCKIMQQTDNVKVLFLEKFGKSLKYEIEQNINYWNEKNIPISGIIAID